MVSVLLQPPPLLTSACLAADLSCIQLVSLPANATCFGAADEAAEAHRGLDLLREGRAYCRQAPLTDPKPVKKATLKGVQPGEIRVTTRDDDFSRLHGKTPVLAKRLNSNEMLGDPRKIELETRILNDIVFTRRTYNNNKVWTFRRSDIGRVASLLGVGCDEVFLKKVQPDEISVTNTDAQFAMIHGKTERLAKRLNGDDMLGDPRKTKAETRILKGIAFTRRKKGTAIVWTFHKSDIGKVAALLGVGCDEVILKDIQPDDVRVTMTDAEFTMIHGVTSRLAKRLNGDEMLGDPNKTEAETKNLKGIAFTRRRKGPTKVWTFRKSDIRQVASLLGVGCDEVILKNVQPDEIRVTRVDAEFGSIHGDKQKSAKRLNGDEMLGNPWKTSEESRTLRGIVFMRRWSGYQKVWTFHKSDIGKVAALLAVGRKDVTLKDMQPDEIGVTRKDAEFAMIHGDTQNLAKRLNGDEMLGNPGNASEESRSLRGVVFTRRRNGRRILWTFHRSDMGEVAALLGVGHDKVMLKDVQPGEISVTQGDAEFAMIHGKAERLAKRLNGDDMLGDPRKVSGESRVLKGIAFMRRRKSSHKVWTFRRSDIGKVAALLGVGHDEMTLKDVQPGEIRVNHCDAEFARMHGVTQNLAKRLNGDEMLGDPNKVSGESRVLKGIVFTRRRSGPHRVWTFRRSDIGNLAASLGVGYDKVILKDVQPGEISVTQSDAEFAMIHGNTSSLAKRLNGDDMLGDPEKASEESTTLEGILFMRRWNVSKKVWTFPSADLHRLERILAKLGIINPNSIYGWYDGVTVEELKDMDAETLRDELVRFDSNEERQVALILQHYGFIKTFDPGRNLQVKMLECSRSLADFVLDIKPTIVLEHHPDYYEEKLNLNSKEERFLKALREINDDELVEGLLEYYSGDLSGEPKDAATRMFLGGYFGTGELDFYDLRRMAMIHASPVFDEFTRYVRTRTVGDLFDQLIWPLYYEPKGELSRSEARQEFEETVLETRAKTERFDATVLPIIFEGEEDDTYTDPSPNETEYVQIGQMDSPTAL